MSKTLDHKDGWSVVRLKEENSGKLSYEFHYPDGDGGIGRSEIKHDLTPKQICRELRSYTTALPKGKDGLELVEKLINELPSGSVIKVNLIGWKGLFDQQSKVARPTAFVAPGLVVPESANYRPPPAVGLGHTAGSLEEWKTEIGSILSKSNYLTFGVFVGLSGPLRPFARLPENPVFNCYGGTSVGKTTLARAAMSTIGHPNAIKSWHETPRKLEELAAQHHHLMLVLNAAERAPVRKRGEILHSITHMLTEGQSQGRSKGVQETFQDLEWSCTVLSTSNKPGPDIGEKNYHWDEQDSVRFIDIPVPPIGEGGIFDNLPADCDRPTEAGDLIKKLEKSLDPSLSPKYGSLLKPWVEHLFELDLANEVEGWISDYLLEDKYSGLDERIARKFAFIYATGMIAIRSGLLRGLKIKPFEAVRALHMRSTAARLEKNTEAREALSKLKKAIATGTAISSLRTGHPIRIAKEADLIGIKCEFRGKSVIAFRKEGLEARYGTPVSKVFLDWLRAHDLIEKGHGNRSGSQLHVRIEIQNMPISSKPRFHVVDAQRLHGSLESI